MKRIINIVSVTMFAILTIAGAASCSDEFLSEKRPYGSFGPELVYGDWSSVKLRLNYIYQKSCPYSKGYSLTKDNYPPDLWPVGLPDMLSQCTEEFTGYADYTDPGNIWDFTNIHKFFFYGINESPWKKMRECTDVIYWVNNVEITDLTDDQKALAESQARFFRATRYFRLFKRFGGVPVIRNIQSTLGGDYDSLAVPRQSTAVTYRFMIDDLTYAGEHLPARWDEEANDWGRITSGAAYALAGIIANYYASPVFNRADDQTRWEEAYELNKTALEKLAEGNFGLAYEGDAGDNASNWAKIWCNVTSSDGTVSEAVYTEICNNTYNSDDKNLFNLWEQNIRPTNADGGGGVSPSAEEVDMFPMADGKRPSESGEYSYNKKLFWLNRDPRFYRTFAFPGTEWKYSGSVSEETMGTQCPYLNGTLYELQNYAWYPTIEDAEDTTQTGYFTDLLGTKGKTVYIRKKSQDYALGMTPLYVFDEEEGFTQNGQPLVAIRYTEVLLNYAEAACGANHLDEAWNALIRIRQRVGYTGDCGLDEAIKGDRARMFEAILYERQIELAYEGKRFDDCHRWMLFDGGVGQSEINNTWALTGWNGNTCSYLGVTPLNNIIRHQIEIMFDPILFTATKSSEHDPFDSLKITRPAALTLSEDMTTGWETVTTEDGTEEQMTYRNDNVKALASLYNQYLVRKDVATMLSLNDSIGIYPVWDKKLYLMGIAYSDQENNPGVVQTIGWNSRFGGTGVFDPLSDNPVTSIEKEEEVNDTTQTAQ